MYFTQYTTHYKHFELLQSATSSSSNDGDIYTHLIWKGDNKNTVYCIWKFWVNTFLKHGVKKVKKPTFANLMVSILNKGCLDINERKFEWHLPICIKCIHKIKFGRMYGPIDRKILYVSLYFVDFFL